MKNHILIVDDNAMNQKVASKMLASMDYEYDIAKDGQEAIHLYSTNNYDLILMDCVMPVVDGYEASRRIRDIERDRTLPHIPIIALSAHSEDSDEIKRCTDSGMDDFLSKPMNMQRLQGLIAKWLERTMSEQSNEEGHNADALSNSTDIRDSLGDQYAELIRIFLRDAPGLIQRLHDAITENNYAEIAYAAHTLRGCSRYVGAQQLSQLCDKIEANATHPDELSSLLKKLQQQFSVVGAILRDQL